MPSAKQRRAAERRRQERQLQRRAERFHRRRRNTWVLSTMGVLVIVAVVAIFVVATGNDDKKPKAAGASSAKSTPSPTASAPTTPATSASPSATSTAPAPITDSCTWTKSGTAAKKVTVPPTTKPADKGTVKIAIDTSQGSMVFTLDRDRPCTTESFVSLVQQKYFDSTSCHRLTTSGIYVLQCGDPTGTGSGGPGYSFRDELTGKEKYTTGVLAMANSGANTNGSQFFIVYKDSTLPPSYTVFGTVTSGMSVVDKVAAKGSDNSNGTGDGKPKLPIEIKTATVEK